MLIGMLVIGLVGCGSSSSSSDTGANSGSETGSNADQNESGGGDTDTPLAADAVRSITLSSELQAFVASANYQLVNLTTTPAVKVNITFQQPQADDYTGDLSPHWFGIGFNETGVMDGADFVIHYISNALDETIGLPINLDQHATGVGGRILSTDDSSADTTVVVGAEDFGSEDNGNRSSQLISVTKLLNNTSDQDFNIIRGATLNLLLSIGVLGDNNTVTQHTNRGSVAITIPDSE